MSRAPVRATAGSAFSVTPATSYSCSGLVRSRPLFAFAPDLLGHQIKEVTGRIQLCESGGRIAVGGQYRHEASPFAAEPEGRHLGQRLGRARVQHRPRVILPAVEQAVAAG